MSTPGARTEPRPMVQPFPPLPPLLEEAHHVLNVAANGTDTQRKNLPPLQQLPKPWQPATCTDPDLRVQLWLWLDDVVAWINHQYTWDTDDTIPTCWPRHPHLIHDLATLADMRYRAGVQPTSDALEEWHRFTLPAFTQRMRARLGKHCATHHEPWPGHSRQVEYRTVEARQRRTRVFSLDVGIDIDTGELM